MIRFIIAIFEDVSSISPAFSSLHISENLAVAKLPEGVNTFSDIFNLYLSIILLSFIS